MIASFLMVAAVWAGVQDDGPDGFLKFGVGTRWIIAVRYSDETPPYERETIVVESKPESLTVESRLLVPGKPSGIKRPEIWSNKDGMIWMGIQPIHKPGSKAGDEWTYKIVDYTFTVVHQGVEEVTVPAGTFPRAIRLHHRGPRGALDFETWLVPGTGVVKTVSKNPKRTIIEELKEFKPSDAPAKKDAAPVSDAEMDALFFKAKLQAAEAHLNSGRKEKAIELLEELLKTYPKSPQIGEAQRLLEKARKK